MLLVVSGVVLLGLAAGFAFAAYKVRRIRRVLTRSGYLHDETFDRGGESPTARISSAESEVDASGGRGIKAAEAIFRRRLVVCGVMALAGIALIVVGSI